MADNYTEFSAMLDNLTPDEEKWLNEQLASDPPVSGCPVFLMDYEEHDPDETDCGFCICFQGEGDSRGLWIYAEEYGEVSRVAHLVRKFLKRFRPDQCWSLSYSNTCSKPCVGEFDGGAVFVTADEIHLQHTHEFIAQQRTAFEAGRNVSAASS